MSEIVKVDREKHLSILSRAYELADGDATSLVNPSDLSQGTNLTTDEFEALLNYLIEEGLLTRPFIGRQVSITHAGIKEVEGLIDTSQRSPQHFQHAQVTNNFYGQVGVAQTGVNTATINMNQANNIEMVMALLTQLKSMKSQIKPEHQAEFEAEVEDVEAEIKNPEKKANWLSKVTRTLDSVKTMGTGVVGILDVADKVKDALTTLTQ